MAHSQDRSPPPSTRPVRTTPLTPAEKSQLVIENRALLDLDLLERRLVFASRPRVVDIQFSNFCNMSCTMCYDGNNPPLERLEDDFAEALAAEVLPTASRLVPFAGSEPLILTWDITRKLAELYGVELELVTNAQFLDEAKFTELEPHVTAVIFSIDSHLPDVYEQIRLRSKSKKVFANLPRAAQLCREHGIEPQANVVFMVENAPWIEDTVAYLADQGCTTVRILEFVQPPSTGPDRAYSDPIRHLSPEWVAWKLGQVKRVAAEKGILVVYEGLERWTVDHRDPAIELRPTPFEEHKPIEQLRHFFPGYCLQSVDRFKVHANGDAYPCCVAEGDDLKLGNVVEEGFEAVWNGREAQDLRRAMLTLDLPDLCKQCSFHTAWWVEERPFLPFITWFHHVHAGGTIPDVAEDRRCVTLLGPDHMTRDEAAPTFRWSLPADRETVDRWLLVLAVGGEFHEDNRVIELPGDTTEWQLPAAEWTALRGNVGHWWTVFGIRDGALDRTVRSALVRCLVRHEPIPRIPGSRLYGAPTPEPAPTA